MGLKNLLLELSGQEVLIPRLRQFLVDQARRERSDSESHRKAVIEDALLSAETFKRRAEEYNHDDPTTKRYFHPSSIGRCLRELWFKRFKAPAFSQGDGRELESFLTFETGTYLHVVIQNLCHRAGVLLKREVEVLDHARRIIGHADGILKLNGRRYLLELKTINSRGFISLQAPKHAHVQQATAYMEVLGLTSAVILYFNKDNGALREFVVSFDEELHAKEVAGRIKTLRQCVKQRVAPDREGFTPKEQPCRYCDYTTLCFSEAATKAFVKALPPPKGKATPCSR
jgi:CRISPR/Cas system-associated exonuclease Cas4 (RecB family)